VKIDNLPPRIVRRLVLAPLVLLLCVALIAVSPVLLLAAFAADLFLPGNWRTLRLVAFLECYFALEVVGLVAMFVLWIASGFGVRIKAPRVQEWHYRFMRRWLGAINLCAKKLFRMKVVIEDRPVPRSGPILVFCRHAGPGNSMLLIGTIMVGYHRHPRIVMLAKLQWEPLYDVMLNRLPNRFIKHDPKRRELYTNAITSLATGLDDDDAFVLFPEGKDFTPRVRLRAIDYLRGKGHLAAAERAEKMKYVLPPRHGGVMAAMKGAPGADIVIVAHAVLEDVGTIKELWGRIPFERPIVARYWRLPPAEVPHEESELIDFLYGWWERIDGWIADRERSGAAI
jgi:Acyltransferase